MLREALDMLREMRASSAMSYAQMALGIALLRSGEIEEAAGVLHEALSLAHAMDDSESLVSAMSALAVVGVEQGEKARSMRLAGIAESLYGAHSARLDPPTRAEYIANIEIARSYMDNELAQYEWQQGRSMAHPDALAYALKPYGLVRE